ncbi:HNH endonuclease [Runella limosa]|uniref:HNH endonuclease n=1 Tax=Runella limosa TaxID=370978 RepID=UPI000490A4E1|nr:HNH endonuclease signature motif containing protein [Runella limosa]
MRQAISAKNRRFVAQRASFRCEYCRLHEDDMFLAFEIDHIIPIKHGGTNQVENLAYACPHCNQHKGSDFATLIDDEIVRLFHPRLDDWHKHFETQQGKIIAKTLVGEATLKIFRFNHPDLLILRQLLSLQGRYP